MMISGVELHQELKNLCVNTNWKYAVFWKLNQQDQMMLTWEDAYCNMDDSYGDDLFEVAITKMSYRVYSIGEGIIGQVAATGKHVWKSGHQVVDSLCSLEGHFDEWKTQCSAGLRTVVVIAVAPYGVVQLGSLNTIAEDLKLVNHIREIFSQLQISLMVSRDCSPCVTELSTRSSSGRLHDHVQTINNNKSNMWKKVETIKNHEQSKSPTNLFIETKIQESLKFPVGCELYEALLGPAFHKQKNNLYWDTVTVNETQTPEETTTASEHLLEAVVGKGSHSHSRPASDLVTGGSGCYSFDKDGSHVRKKQRLRTGQRPRDRQLIQDRIKELRDLVPNGSKCSIDSLLEQTIQHMHFLQHVTKHADKIDTRTDFKLLRGHGHGSSWAMEIGNDLELCPIIVENIGVNGKMLIEMMCDECVDFLEITGAIRSLGLTILKGVTNMYGDKIRMCFVVEGENNRNIHRVDLLLSLIQILQLKTNI